MNELLFRFAVALGIGLLIGAERERRKGAGPARRASGIRTFAIGALIGAVSWTLGGAGMLGFALLVVAGLTGVAYVRARDEDPGLTTEVALLLTLLLGALAMREPPVASALAVTLAILLAARSRMHHFVSAVLSEEELADALILAAATLVALPLIPDRAMGPFEAINPRTIWKIVILVMSISAAGYVAVRLLGPRYGLALAGLASGFVSSAATIGSMGARALAQPALLRPAVAGAVLSTVATVLQMAAILAVTSGATLSALGAPLVAAGCTAVVYGAVVTWRNSRHDAGESASLGRAFSLQTALAFAATMALVLLGSAALNAWLGRAGVLAAAAMAGFADTHAAAMSVAALVAAGKLQPGEAVLPILAGLTTNTVTKAALALTGGGRRFAVQITPGLILVIAAAWIGAALTVVP